MIVYIILTMVTILIWPESLYAWGPGTHLETGINLIAKAASFSPTVALLVKKFRDEFLYGMVGADILVGKKYAGYLHHSHNWASGWKILKACKTDPERASAYGYLTHLAADIIAHDYYIPLMIIKSYDTKLKNHTYWEMRFDMHVEPSIWDEMKRVINSNFGDFDKILDKNLRRPLFSFGTNKKIFKSILIVQKFRQLRKAVELHAKLSQWPLSGEEVTHYKRLITAVTSDFLTRLSESKSQTGDPSGLSRLAYAARIRKSIRQFSSKGLLTNRDIERFIDTLNVRLKNALFIPDALLPESYEVL